MKIGVGVILFFLFVFTSCKKAEDRACFKGAGENTVREITLTDEVDSLYLYDNLYYTIVPSKENKIVVEGGENLVPFIEVKEGNKTISVENTNKCNFLRSYKNEIKVSLFVDSIRFIKYMGSKHLYTQDTLRSNELRLVITDGAGDVNLLLQNGYTSAVITHGFGNFTLKGRTQYGHLHCSTNSYCDTRLFVAEESLHVKSNTVGEMLVNADTKHFYPSIFQSGDIKYTGVPIKTKLERSGKGSLIDLNN